MQRWIAAMCLLSWNLYGALTFHSLLVDEMRIELIDGSQWDISDTELPIAKAWHTGDRLTIRPDYVWFSDYHYSIYNEDCPSKLKANLIGGSFIFGPLSNWIIHIDCLSKHLYLQDGTIWCVHAKDEELLAEWDVNDHIILGHEDSRWSHHPHLLINVNMNQHVRACKK